MTTICLSMIVKNESNIIIKTLEELRKHFLITFFVICDTGSDDNTIELIKNYYLINKLNGEIHKHKWVNFGHNRNLALDISRTKAEYSLFFDADDSIIGEFKIPNILNYDLYYFKINNNHSRPLLIKNRNDIKWYGILHECISVTDKNTNITQENVDGNYYINSGHFGHRSQNKYKYIEDGNLLENEIIKINENGGEENMNEDEKCLYTRYLYYCAQSYNDASKFNDLLYLNKALKYYNLVIENKNSWNEEKYISCIELCYYYAKEKNYDKYLYYILLSEKYNKNERIELICELFKYCINFENYSLAKQFYDKYKNYNENNYTLNKYLFIKLEYYNGLFEYLYSLCAKHNDDYTEGLRCCEYLQSNKLFIKENKRNIEFFKKKLSVTEIKTRYLNSIVFFTFCNSEFNITNLNKHSLGGSEKAICNLAIQFAKAGEDVILVSNSIIEETVILENNKTIKCINYNNYINEIINNYTIKCIIISRYLDFFKIFPNYTCDKLILVQHDTVYMKWNNSMNLILNEKDLEKIDHFIFLTKWQRINALKNYNFLTKYNFYNKIITINNGIDYDLIQSCKKNIKKVKNRFIYSSNPERGLDKILNLWTKIQDNLENPTLYISYAYGNFDNKLLVKIDELNKKTQSIFFMNKLNSIDLYSLMHSCEFWFYPTDFLETSCITSLEVLCCSIIPFYNNIGGLHNTLNNSKLGIVLKKDCEIEQIYNISIDDKRKNEIINNGLEYVKNQTWNIRANEWLKLINEKINYKIYVVNLDRRNDKKFNIKLKFNNYPNIKYDFYRAIDGKELQINNKIVDIFYNNCFGNKKGVIGCALSHLTLWKQLINDNNNDFYVIFEDDVELCENFDIKLNEITKNFSKNNYDLLYLGSFHNYNNYNKNNDDIFECEILNRNQANGTFGYIISKKAAKDILEFIDNNSCFKPIDYIIYYGIKTKPNFLKNNLVNSPNALMQLNVDSDIQMISDNFDDFNYKYE